MTLPELGRGHSGIGLMGQVAGFALDGAFDPFSPLGHATSAMAHRMSATSHPGDEVAHIRR